MNNVNVVSDTVLEGFPVHRNEMVSGADPFLKRLGMRIDVQDLRIGETVDSYERLKPDVAEYKTRVEQRNQRNEKEQMRPDPGFLAFFSRSLK